MGVVPGGSDYDRKDMLRRDHQTFNRAAPKDRRPARKDKADIDPDLAAKRLRQSRWLIPLDLVAAVAWALPGGTLRSPWLRAVAVVLTLSFALTTILSIPKWRRAVEASRARPGNGNSPVGQ